MAGIGNLVRFINSIGRPKGEPYKTIATSANTKTTKIMVIVGLVVVAIIIVAFIVSILPFPF